ncbi:MAG TPA: shikimate dehydrogenase [Pyrinomonadaceae bacterium]|nr:shikimate dehydrogenase [Pyrinomonadaceae bacterium]
MNRTLCISICEHDWSAFQKAVSIAARREVMIELRLDCLDPTHLFENNELTQLIAGCDAPTIVTLRANEEGGARDVSLEQRINFWTTVGFNLPSTFVDLERDVVQRLIDANITVDWSRVICSYHERREANADPSRIFEEMSRVPARILKIACHADDAVDSLASFQLLETAAKSEREIISIAMGQPGVVTRILGPARGSFLTYASLSADKPTAAGQLTIDDLSDVYNVSNINKSTKIMGLVGRPVSHSISPQINNAAFRQLGTDAVYIPFEVIDVDAFFRRMVHPRIREIEWPLRGLSVTAPHKKAVMSHLDWIDPLAREIDAVNTIVIEAGQVRGYNTDADAFVTPLKQRLSSLKNLRIAVIGAGGVANAVMHSLKKEKAAIVVFGRNPEAVRTFSSRWDVEFEDLAEANFSNCEVVINATPLGTKGALESETAAVAEQLRGARLAYDLVYNPISTRFLREARAAGCETIDGLEMFLAQAMKQSELWTGQSPSYDVMRTAALKALK